MGKICVFVLAFLVAMLVPACFRYVGIPEDGACGSDATMPSDSGIDSPLSIDASVRMDARSEAIDASNPQDAQHDSDASFDASAPRQEEARALVLDPLLCSGRHLSMTDEMELLFKSDLPVWHVCYRTPSAMTSNHPQARVRSARVSIVRYDSVSMRTVALATAMAPRTANPWTANFIATIPSDALALFNLRNEREDGSSIWAVQENRAGGMVELNGELRAWQVTADGTQTQVDIRALCRTTSTSPPAFVVLRSSCPTTLASCGLGAYTCR